MNTQSTPGPSYSNSPYISKATAADLESFDKHLTGTVNLTAEKIKQLSSAIKNAKETAVSFTTNVNCTSASPNFSNYAYIPPDSEIVEIGASGGLVPGNTSYPSHYSGAVDNSTSNVGTSNSYTALLKEKRELETELLIARQHLAHAAKAKNAIHVTVEEDREIRLED
jgi:hypothetical protein